MSKRRAYGPVTTADRSSLFPIELPQSPGNATLGGCGTPQPRDRGPGGLTLPGLRPRRGPGWDGRTRPGAAAFQTAQVNVIRRRYLQGRGPSRCTGRRSGLGAGVAALTPALRSPIRLPTSPDRPQPWQRQQSEQAGWEQTLQG
jgi:hypothetical protein